MLNRDIYLNRLYGQKDKDLVKIITGIRRCGKSTLHKLAKAMCFRMEDLLEPNYENFY